MSIAATIVKTGFTHTRKIVTCTINAPMAINGPTKNVQKERVKKSQTKSRKISKYLEMSKKSRVKKSRQKYKISYKIEIWLNFIRLDLGHKDYLPEKKSKSHFRTLFHTVFQIWGQKSEFLGNVKFVTLTRSFVQSRFTGLWLAEQRRLRIGSVKMGMLPKLCWRQMVESNSSYKVLQRMFRLEQTSRKGS